MLRNLIENLLASGFHGVSYSASFREVVTIKYCISTLFEAGQVAVTEVYNTDEVSECDKEILAHCVLHFKGKMNLLFL